MTKEQLVALLNGREIGEEITTAEESDAEKSGLVVVFGASDDLIEFRGAIDDESDCYNGGDVLLNIEGVIESHEDCECKYCGYKEATKAAGKITAVWAMDGISWQYRTEIPHATFEIKEDGQTYCRGIVFELASLDGRPRA